MTYICKVSNGVVVLPPEAKIQDGTEVKVETVERKTLAERLKPLIGCIKGMPSDLAAKHDEYLHGKRK
ncbi:MAG TPA: hypothetical protein VGP72_15870 [Planctomycetota bacterium]|jgi:hypothetical protein